MGTSVGSQAKVGGKSSLLGATVAGAVRRRDARPRVEPDVPSHRRCRTAHPESPPTSNRKFLVLPGVEPQAPRPPPGSWTYSIRFGSTPASRYLSAGHRDSGGAHSRARRSGTRAERIGAQLREAAHHRQVQCPARERPAEVDVSERGRSRRHPGPAPRAPHGRPTSHRPLPTPGLPALWALWALGALGALWALGA